MTRKRQHDGSGSRTRRDFIKTTAATTAGVFFGTSAAVRAGARARPQQEAPAPAEQPASFPADRAGVVRLGVIGTGGMGSAHLVDFIRLRNEKLDNVEITAICDVAVPRLESNQGGVREKQGIEPKTYTDYRALLDSKDVDAVVVATPEHWHARMAIDAMDAGKDVYLEKPMTLRLGEALELYRFAEGRKEKLEVGTQYLTYQKYHDARKMIAAGEIGHPTFSQTSYCRNSAQGEWLYGIDERIVPGEALDWVAWCGPLGPQPWDPEVYHRWRRYRKYSTGIIGDLLVHKMTPLVFAVDPGWPVRVTAAGGHYVDKAMENHDQVNITVEFEKEHTMVVAGSTCNEYGLEEVIRGHKANLFSAGNQLDFRPEPTFVREEELEGEKIQYEGHDPHPAIRLDFLECVRTRKDPVSPVETATKVMVIVELAARSMWEGRAYRFDPGTMTARSI